MRRSVVFGALICSAALAVVPVAGVGRDFDRQPPAGQQPPTPQPLGVAAAQTRDEQIYLRFRAWIGQQPRSVQMSGDVLDRYRAKLAADGVPAATIDEEIKVIERQGEKLEVDQWNKILTSPKARFNREPNAFLVQMVTGRTPGTALDVGMGQGRNALYLAKQGWTVTGFDPANEAVALARTEAERDGLKITATTNRDSDFDWGRDRWDLIVMSYVDVRSNVRRIMESLRPGGVVVIEGFQRDATKDHPIGGAVVFDTNELLALFAPLRVLRYEDTDAVGDFGMERTRVVRLCAQKPQ